MKAVKINNEILRKAYEGSYYTIIGAGGDLQEWKDGYNEMLSEQGIGTVSKWITFKGSDMNTEFKLEDNNKYPDDLTFLAFPLDGLNVPKLAIFRIQMNDKWFDDIVDNNEKRKKEAV